MSLEALWPAAPATSAALAGVGTNAVVAAIVGALAGIIGGAFVRFALDRRQELVTARAFARVIQDELQLNARIVRGVIDLELPLEALSRVSAAAWREHAAAVAGQLHEFGFLALSTTYRASAGLPFVAGELPVGPDVLEPEANGPMAPTEEESGETTGAVQEGFDDPELIWERLRGELAEILLVIERIGMPAIAVLASAETHWWHRRRPMAVLTPDPRAVCHCGHHFDHHRWTTRKRRFRLRWREWRGIEIAHECNLADCGCRHFTVHGASSWSRLLGRLNLVPQAPYLSTSLGDKPDPDADDVRYPPGAQPLKRRGEALVEPIPDPSEEPPGPGDDPTLGE